MKTWHYAIQTTNGQSCEFHSPYHPLSFEAAQDAAARAIDLGGKAAGTDVFLVYVPEQGEAERFKLGALTPIHEGTAFAIS